MRKRKSDIEGQGSLFAAEPARPRPPRDDKAGGWRMPELHGSTVAAIRVRWGKRLTPGQVARVEAMLGDLPNRLSKLGYGKVDVERIFVRRRKS